MSENESPFESAFRSLPEEYRAWYNSRFIFGGGPNDAEDEEATGVLSSEMNASEWPSETSQPETGSDFALPPMPPFESLSSPNSSRHFFNNRERVCNRETSGENSETNGNLNSWNYLYYLQLLNEVERERRSSQASAFSAESQETDNSANDLSFASDRPAESYSEKLKKGLGNETANLPNDKTNFASPSFFSTDGNRDLKNERRNSSSSKSVNKKNSKKKANLETDFVQSEEIKPDNSESKRQLGGGNYCEACKCRPFAALNNTLPANSCPSGIKCPLNVNNLRKKANEDEERKMGNDPSGERGKDETNSAKERDKKLSNSNLKNKKNKGRNVLNGLRKENPEERDGESEIKAKRKNFSVKGRQRSDRGKLPRHSGSRKRHSNETEKESILDHFVTFYTIIWSSVSQWPSQPWFKYTLDGIVSLFGVVVGSLCVFIVIAWEGQGCRRPGKVGEFQNWSKKSGNFVMKKLWQPCDLVKPLTVRWLTFKTFKTACSSYAHRGYQWFKLRALSVIFTIFLKTPGLSGYVAKAAAKSTENPKFEKLPNNGSEAVERLLKLKGQDPYLILGVPSDCGDEDIKKRYKTQAVLVHPDKNNFPGAEEAFKVLASAFEILGNTEKRAEFDKENNVRLEGNEEMASFLERIQKNIEEIQSILGCRSCGKSHKRYKTEKQADNARFCAACKTHHVARLGDLWAETSMFGFKWHYYAYLDSAIYDVTEWVTCQTDLMATVEANTHAVPCRLATPKNKNRTSAHSRMEDLKDLVNDLLSKSRRGNAESAFTTTSDPKTNEAKSKTRKQGEAKRRRK